MPAGISRFDIGHLGMNRYIAIQLCVNRRPASNVLWVRLPAKGEKAPPSRPEMHVGPPASQKERDAVREKQAAAKLALAKGLLRRNPDAAKRRLQDILNAYPNTRAAAEAKKLLNVPQ